MKLTEIINLYDLHSDPAQLTGTEDDVQELRLLKAKQILTGTSWNKKEELAKYIDDIKSDPKCAYIYARDVIKGRWPEGESVIKSDPEHAYTYARYVIKGRWPEGESAIKSNPYSAYTYARYVIKGRWPEGESAMKSNRYYSHAYARDVLKLPAHQLNQWGSNETN